MHQQFSRMKPTIAFPRLFNVFFSVLYQGQFLHLDFQSLHELLIFHPLSDAVMAKYFSVKTQLLHKDSIPHTGLDIHHCHLIHFEFGLKKRFFKELKLQRNIF